MDQRLIHRMNSRGLPRCGVPSGKVSTTGVVVTCPECKRMSQPAPSVAEYLARIAKEVSNA